MSGHLVEALKKASPKDLTTFYMVVNDGQHKRSITSGGIFVDEKRRLHLILANWRSVPSGGQDYTMAMELDTATSRCYPFHRFVLASDFFTKRRGSRTVVLGAIGVFPRTIPPMSTLPNQS